MVYKKFLKKIHHQLQEKFGSEYSINIHSVTKNNGTVLDGLMIQAPDSSVAPTIYLNSYYEQFQDGMELDDIVSDIFELLQLGSKPLPFDINEISKFPLMKDKIVFRIINLKANKSLLSDIPHIPFLDLAIVFYLFLCENPSGQMTTLIHNEQLKTWGITQKELQSLAFSNSQQRFPAKIESMSSVISIIAQETSGEKIHADIVNPQSSLYVLTNSTGLNGAGCILYKETLKDFANTIGRDLIILPSSIHEVLLTPNFPDICYQELRNMVISINKSDVPLEDQLSNEIYLYSRSQDKVSVIPVT